MWLLLFVDNDTPVEGEEDAKRRMIPMALSDPTHWLFAQEPRATLVQDVTDYGDSDIDEDV